MIFQSTDMEYRVHLKQFDGPLDLLIHLIEKAEVDIKDIFISEITSEFLSYMTELDELDMEQASEFLTVAATLVYAKSRSLFPPVLKETDGDETEEDPGEALIRQLREYKAFKEAAKTMRELAHEAYGMRTKPPEEFPLPPKEIILRDTTVERLFAAMLSVLGRCGEEKQREHVHTVQKDEFTVRGCTRRIRGVLRSENGKTTFGRLTDGAGRSEIIVTFMSLLEMISNGEIRLEQTDYCGEITIFGVKLLSDDNTVNYIDEQD